MQLAALYGVELDHQMEMLRKEIAGWPKHGLPVSIPRQRHKTQFDRITFILSGLLDKAEPSGTLEGNKMLEARLLFARRTFLYFTSKLEQRAVRMYVNQLECADEFAWQCYEPLRIAAEDAAKTEVTDMERMNKLGELKAPPLVYYGHTAGPVTFRRGTQFLPLGVTSHDFYGKAFATLPIPLIEVPWFLAEHLPSASVIAHEVGHSVERDFGAEKIHEDAINSFGAQADPQREIWQAWRAEMFADVFGALCVGPAFLQALLPFIADTAVIVRSERPDTENGATSGWGQYPTAHLRVAFNLKVLETLGFGDAAQAMRNTWQATYNEAPTWQYYDLLKTDIASGKIVSVFLDAALPALGNRRIRDVIAATPSDWAQVKVRATTLDTVPPGDPHADVFRWTYAAATHAYYSDPQQYKQKYMFGYSQAQLPQYGKIEQSLFGLLEPMRDSKTRIMARSEVDEAQFQRALTMADLAKVEFLNDTLVRAMSSTKQ